MNTSFENGNIIYDANKIAPGLIIFAVFTSGSFVIIGSMGNICVIIAISRKRNLRTTSNYLTVALMCFSLLHIAISYPLQVLSDLSFFTRQPACYLAGNFPVCTTTQLALTLPLLSVERYITIARPLKADIIFTSRRVGFLIGFIAVYSVFGSYGVSGLTWIGKEDLWQETRRCVLSFAMPSSETMLLLFSPILLLVPTMIVLYVRIYLIVRKHIRSISALQCPVTLGHGTVEGPQRYTRRLIPQEAKSALRLFFVVVVYITNWVPGTFLLLAGIFLGKEPSPFVYILIHTFGKTVGIVAPYTYGLGNRMVRHEVKAMLFPRSSIKLTDNTGNSVALVTMKRTRQGPEYGGDGNVSCTNGGRIC